MSEDAARQPWGARVGFLTGVVTLLGLTWWATHETDAVIACLMLVPSFHAVYESLSTRRRGKPAWNPRSLRFSIGQVIVVTVLVAGLLALLRGLFTAYPTQDDGIKLTLSVAVSFVYVMFCFVAYMTWVRVGNIRAVLRGERLQHGNSRSQPTGKEDAKGGGPWDDGPGSRLAGS